MLCRGSTEFAPLGHVNPVSSLEAWGCNASSGTAGWHRSLAPTAALRQARARIHRMQPFSSTAILCVLSAHTKLGPPSSSQARAGHG